MLTDRSRKSTPMVASVRSGKRPLQKRKDRHVFPTPASPIIITWQKDQKSVHQRRFLKSSRDSDLLCPSQTFELKTSGSEIAKALSTNADSE